MNKFIVDSLDLNSSQQIKEYERAQFRAFLGSDIKTLSEIWVFENLNKRLRTKIPYKNQFIGVARLNGSIIGGIAVNTNMKEPLQLEMMGFRIDKKEKNICEGLSIFNLRILNGITPVAFELGKYAFKKLSNASITKTYGTCSKKKLRGYKQLGFLRLEEKIFKGEKKYLLCKTTKDHNEQYF